VEMPGVEPGSEAESPKLTTCVFVLQVLASQGTERQVLPGQLQNNLTVGPEAQLPASLCGV